MVPLKPNELSREAAFASPDRGSTSPGMRNDPNDTIDARCAFSLSRVGARFLHQANSNTNRRSCALTATTLASNGPATSDDRLAAAAAASRWPRFDLRDVHSAGSLARARDAAPTYVDAVSNSRSHFFACFLQHLDGVAERRSRAVRLEARNARRRSVCSDPHRLDEPLLRRAVRRRQARARPVLPHRRPENRNFAVRASPHQKRPAALAAAVAVRP